MISAEIGAGILLEGANTLVLENVGDTGGLLLHGLPEPVLPDLPESAWWRSRDILQGTFGESGTAEVGEVDGGGHVLDVQAAIPRG